MLSTIAISELIEQMLAAGAPMPAVMIAIKAIESGQREAKAVQGELKQAFEKAFTELKAVTLQKQEDDVTRREAVRQRVKKCRENKRAVTLQSRYGNGFEDLSILPSSSVEPSSVKQERSEIEALGPWPRDYKERFWAAYPRKVGKDGALRKLDQIRKAGQVKFDDLMAGVSRYVAAGIEPGFTKHPETWLNKGCWKDDPRALARGVQNTNQPGSWKDDRQERNYRASKAWHDKFVGGDSSDVEGTSRDAGDEDAGVILDLEPTQPGSLHAGAGRDADEIPFFDRRSRMRGSSQG